MFKTHDLSWRICKDSSQIGSSLSAISKVTWEDFCWERSRVLCPRETHSPWSKTSKAKLMRRSKARSTKIEQSSLNSHTCLKSNILNFILNIIKIDNLKINFSEKLDLKSWTYSEPELCVGTHMMTSFDLFTKILGLMSSHWW